jgi:hypothetical protein
MKHHLPQSQGHPATGKLNPSKHGVDDDTPSTPKGEPARAPSRRKKGGRIHRDRSAPNRDAGDARTLDTVTDAERIKLLSELRKRERIIQQGRDAWQAGATALVEIRDFRYYRAKGYTDFGRYCREDRHIGKSTVNRQIAIAEVYKAVASTEATILPSSERQMRPLLCLRKPQQEPAVWGKAVAQVWVKAVNDAKITKKKLTQKSVLHALQQLGLDPKPKDSQPEADLEKRWTRLEALLEHEKEFWLGEHLHELRVRIVGLVSGWAHGQGHPLKSDEASAPKASDITEKEPRVGKGTEAGAQKPGERAHHCQFANWEHVNWRLHNRDLAAIWGIKVLTVRQMRTRKQHGRAQKVATEVYQKEIEQEKAKAEAFLKSHPAVETPPL